MFAGNGSFRFGKFGAVYLLDRTKYCELHLGLQADCRQFEYERRNETDQGQGREAALLLQR